MFRIGEFSKLTQVTIRMLRYYDEMGLLKPAEIDKWTGYRMYSTLQIPVLNKIIYLRDSGFNVAEIAVALNNQDDSFVIEQLEYKYREIERIIQVEKEKLRKIELAKKELQSTKNEIHYDIVNISFHELIWKILHDTPTGVQRPCADQGYRGQEAHWVFNAR